MLAALHTWSSTMLLHPHLHCIVPAGALTKDQQWQDSKNNGDFLVRGNKLARYFKYCFLQQLEVLWESGTFDFGVDIQTGELLTAHPEDELMRLADPAKMKAFLLQLRQINWNVRIEKPMSGIEHVINYLARYVYRIAITNHRIKEVGERTASFEYNNYAATKEGAPTQKDIMEISGVEFMRRFALHILPLYFQRVRHYGFYAAAAKQTLADTRKSIGHRAWCYTLRTIAQIVAAFLGHDADMCPACNAHKSWQTAEILPANPFSKRHYQRATAARPPPAIKGNRQDLSVLEAL